MAVTYGFYNSSNGDRKYNALQFSRLFEGIIRDGVFSTVGGSLMVVAASNLTVNISPGRAWFNNTWTNNDALLPLTLDPAEAMLNRYDAIVLEVAPDERENRFKIVKGTPATTPAKPTMIKTGGIYQYPLAYIYVGKGVESISQANISNAVGTTECPFITGALQQVTTDDIIAQWESEFNTWFDNLQAQLEGNVVTNLQNQINTKLTADGGDGKDVVVSFTEAATEAHIASGEKLSVLFGKILKMFKGKAPNSHASTATTYGLGTTTDYGHVKTINGLTQSSHVNGTALSAYQGKVILDMIDSDYTTKLIISSQSWAVPANVRSVDVFFANGGEGGGGGGGGKGQTTSGQQATANGGAGGDGGHAGLIMGFKVTPGESIPIVIGAGGAGGAGGVYTATATGTQPGTGGSEGGVTSFKGLYFFSYSLYDTTKLGTGGKAGENGTQMQVPFANAVYNVSPLDSAPYGGGGGGGAEMTVNMDGWQPGANGQGANYGRNGGAAVYSSSTGTATGGAGGDGILSGGGGGGGGALGLRTQSGTVTGGKGGKGGNGFVLIRYKRGM